jgi:flagellar assembly protein FliH
MASILRSPSISGETRKLTTRRGRAQTAAAADAEAQKPVPAASPIAQPVTSPPAPVAPAVDIQALVNQARESVLEQFKEEAEKGRELGRQRGLQEGREAGAEEARQQFAAELARVRGIADRLQAALEGGMQGLEPMAAAIAFEAVAKILGEQAVTPEGILALVRQAASRYASRDGVLVRLNPADLSALRAAGALEAELPSGGKADWLADQSVEMGGCIVEAAGGELDARLETQMEALRAALLAARRNA